MGHWVVAFLVQLAVSALVLMLAVAWVTPKNPRKTAGRAALVSLVLSAASTLTLARFAWFLLFPLLLYALVWVVVVTVAYKVTVARAALFALALSFISWAVAFGIPT
jgi:fucose 4-O-acetylase-like acetyltransferase